MESAAIAAPIRAELFFAKCASMAVVAFVYGVICSGLATAIVFIGLTSKDFSIGFDDPDVSAHLARVPGRHRAVRPRRRVRRLAVQVERVGDGTW